MNAKDNRPPASRGEDARNPGEIPPQGWRQVLRRGMKAAKADNVPIVAGGVAFFGFLALFPAIIAALTLYGLVSDPATIARQTGQLTAAMPSGAGAVIGGQLSAVTSAAGGALTVGLIISLLAALWSASGGVGNLVTGINIAYDEKDERGFVKSKALALLITLIVIVFALVTLALVAVVPVVFSSLGLGGIGRAVGQIVRWVLLIVLFMIVLSVLYRLAPDRTPARWSWVSPGAVVATALWIIASVVFSLYINFFGNYNKTYGALAGVVVLMLWMYLSSYLVLLGAEINSEAERQTARDTTVGEARPEGSRGAVSADTQAEEARKPSLARRRPEGT